MEELERQQREAPSPRKTNPGQLWVAAGLCLTRAAPARADALNALSPMLEAAFAELPAVPPLGVLADLALLLQSAASGSVARPVGAPPGADPRLRAAVRAYEDHVLARLAGDRHLDAAADAYARLAPERRPLATAIFCGQILERLGHAGTLTLAPQSARRLLRLPAADLLAQGHALLRSAGPDTQALAESYEALSAAARRAPALLGDREVFVLENHAALGSMAQRVAVEQVVEAAEALTRTLPRRPSARRSARGAAPTSLDDESAYPAGGFSSMGTSGSLENLVTSELIYMSPRGEGGADAIDLFDVRYVEGELLYYVRDEAIHARRRTAITFVLAADLDDARVKDRDVPFQRVVLGLAMVLSSVRRLIEWLNEESLTFHVRVVRAEGTPPGDEETLLTLLLREWIERGVLELTTTASLDVALLEADARSRTSLSDVVVIGPAPMVFERPAKSRMRVASVVLAAPPLLSWKGAPQAVTAGAEPEGFDAWSALLIDLLEGIS